MAEQTRRGKPTKEEEAAPQEEKAAETEASDVDDLLDEIDEVLEINAEEFVRSYIQKGGQLVVPSSLLTGLHASNRLWVAVLLIGALVLRRVAERRWARDPVAPPR
ncbi:MAG: ubiquitin-like protein Pup [Actinobacteria bacterium]|nr:ubiquitin-like protein Pup [Actinomycetota bacterium]